MKGIVFNIQRFSVDDGPGIRTTVFLKGCPLRCAWCHNPESHKMSPEILFDQSKCVLCSSCAQVCKNHIIQGGTHIFSRDSCLSCGKCVDSCFTGALELCGKEMSDTEVIQTVLRDRPFYQNTGGMTLSGGEPLMQYRFSLSLLKLSKENGIHTAVETSGYADSEHFKEIADFTDLFLYDIKLSDNQSHVEYTGAEIKRISDNLELLESLSKRIILRCPMIPGVNLTKDHISYIFALSKKYSSVESVEFEPYHPLGINKSRLVGRNSAYASEEFLDKEQIRKLIDELNLPITKPYLIH